MARRRARPRPGNRRRQGVPGQLQFPLRRRRPWPWFQGSAYDGVYIAAECLRQTNDDQDAGGFRDCLYNLTWSGAIGDDYRFDKNGDVVGVSHVVIEVLPVAERTPENLGYRVLGPPAAP